jgi:hypothetical protein
VGNYLALERSVSAPTQKQALNAMIYLHILRRPGAGVVSPLDFHP